MGYFLVIDGLDASGKSTHSKSLADYLRGQGREVVLTTEPTDGPVGKLIRSVLRKEVSVPPLALQFLFTADRSYHLHNVIEPTLEQGNIAISDRYDLSTGAYGGLDVDMDFLMTINSKFRRPDLTLFLDVPPEECLRRLIQDRNDFELFEDLEKLRKVRKNYLRLAETYPNMHIIDGNRKTEEVAEDVQKIVLERIK